MTNSEVMQLFNTAVTLGRGYLSQGGAAGASDAALAAIDEAMAAIDNSDLSDSEKRGAISILSELQQDVVDKRQLTVSEEPEYQTDDPAQLYPQPQQTISTTADPGVTGQQILDDGSDPFTSNGVSTITRADISTDPSSIGSAKGLQGLIKNTRAQATAQDISQFSLSKDWRVKLSLGPAASYLYMSPQPGILKPLRDTMGVIFPYTPQISVVYAANYDGTELTHSNYKIFQYKNSAVETVSLTCTFTAQDTHEANYLLAVIHFFRSVTKMFYGQDENPRQGTPPPLCYLTGLGDYQFNGHPLAVTGFTYNLPDDVDYVRADTTSEVAAGVSEYGAASVYSFMDPAQMRMGSQISKGGGGPSVQWSTSPSASTPTYVPTKIQLIITTVPIVARNAVSNYFSLKNYATGQLLLGDKRLSGGYYGGMW